jgi:hypothetical protein
LCNNCFIARWSQRAIFDVAVAGPAAALSVSLMLLITGLYLTSTASLQQLATFPLVDGGVLTLGEPAFFLLLSLFALSGLLFVL